jgi:Helix-turn-helix domain
MRADQCQNNGLGTFPKRVDTVRATVLARMLRGEQLTAMDGVLDASTTRLAGSVHILRRKLGWHVVTDDVQVPTADGRIAEVARYSLPPEVIAAARATGAGAFIDRAMAACAARRAGSSGRG